MPDAAPASCAAAVLHAVIVQCRHVPSLRAAHALVAAHPRLSAHLPTLGALLLSYAAAGDLHSAALLFRSARPALLRRAFLHNSFARALSAASLPLPALAVYNRMRRFGVAPDDRTFPFTLSAVADARALSKGRELHAAAICFGFDSDVFVGNTLMSFYSVCGCTSDACQMFDQMLVRDTITWNTLITAYAANGCVRDTKRAVVELKRSELEVTAVGLLSALPAVCVAGDVGFGSSLHCLSVKSGLSEYERLANAFIDMYGKFGDLDASLRFFHTMSERNEVSWNSVIGAFAHCNRDRDAVRLFRDMLIDEVGPSSTTISTVLPSLIELGLFRVGREVHGYSLRKGLDCDIYVANSLLDMYAKCGDCSKASNVFEKMPDRNAVSWNCMIANFAQNGPESEVFGLLLEMQRSGECPNSVTFANLLPVCAKLDLLDKGKEIHGASIRMGLVDIFVSNALIDMYAKCGQLDLARHVFDRSEKDDFSYNSLINGYAQNQQCAVALELFREMRHVGIEYDIISFMGALSACANLDAFKQGKAVHGVLVRTLISEHMFVTNSVLDLYIKGGKFDTAMKIFKKMPEKDVASWNCMIVGYGMNGDLETAFKLFDQMKDEGVEYDHVSYIVVLTACAHSGLVEQGKKYFSQMLEGTMKPRQMHYACMVDLLGRAGLLGEATDLIRGMPFEPDFNVWGALLGACSIHGNIELARWAADHLFVLKPEHSGYYTVMANMYAAAGRCSEASEIRRMMRSRKVLKDRAYSWVQCGDKVHAFMVGGG